MTHRFFIPPTWLTPPHVTLHDEVAHQVSQVLRLRVGQEVIVLDNSGQAWRMELTEMSQKRVTGRIIALHPLTTEPHCQVTLYQGMLKGDKLEWILQKGTELGVTQFVPVISQRAIIQASADIEKKYPRWRKIIQEAAEQSGRAQLPILAPAVTIKQAITALAPTARLILAWEQAAQVSLKEALHPPNNSIALFIGPEGGFTAEEVALAQQAGGQVVTLGARILRAETASLAALAAIFYEYEA